MLDNFIIKDKSNLSIFAEHTGKKYIVYFKEIGDILYFEFPTRHSMEEFIYRNGYEIFTYKSSNGQEINKKWEYKQEELDEYKRWYGTKKKSTPQKYSWDDWYCGHFIKQ